MACPMGMKIKYTMEYIVGGATEGMLSIDQLYASMNNTLLSRPLNANLVVTDILLSILCNRTIDTKCEGAN